MPGLMQLFEFTKCDLESLYGPVAPYASFESIIEMEY